MNDDQLAILRLVADAAHDYVLAIDTASDPYYSNRLDTPYINSDPIADHAAQCYEKLKTAISHYRTAFDIK